MRKKISQAEARGLRKQVEALTRMREQERDAWASNWGPGWVNIAAITVPDAEHAKIKTARLLKHAVVAVHDSGGIIRFYASRQQ